MIGGVLAHSLSYFLMPLLTRYLSPSEYGIVYVFNSLMMFFIPLVGLQTDTYFSRHFFEIEKSVFAQHVAAIIKVVAASMLLVIGVLYLFHSLTASLFTVSEHIVVLGVIIAGFTIIGTLGLRCYQMENNAGAYIGIVLLVTLINLFVSIFLVVVCNLGWRGRIIGIAASVSIQAVLALILLEKKGYLKFDLSLRYTKEVTLFGLPLLLGAMSGWIVNLADKLFVAKLVSLSATGIYGIGASLGMAMGLLSDSFARAWVPFFFKNIKDNSHEKNVRIVKMTYIFALSILLCAFAMTFLSYVFIKFFIAKEYLESFKYVLWISLGQGLAGINSLFLYYLIYEKKNMLISWLSLVSAGANLMLNYILIRRFGAVGAAYTVFLSFLLGTIVTIIFSTRHHKMPWLFFLRSRIIIPQPNEEIRHG